MPLPPHSVMLYATPAAFFESLFAPLQHDAHVLKRHREMWLREQEDRTADAYVAVLAETARIMGREPTPIEQACAEVRAWQRRKHLRVVA